MGEPAEKPELITTGSSVVVVGAGLAGLTAAYRLQAAGADVMVLEARDRVGGRLFSTGEGFSAGQRCDLGGELIDGTYRCVPQLCDELGLELTSPVSLQRQDARAAESPLESFLEPGRFVIGGEVLDGEAFSAVETELREAVRTAAPALHEAVEQWVRRSRLSPAAAAVARAISLMPNQIDGWEVDVHYLFGVRMGSAVRRIKGGADRLPQALADQLDVRLASPVAVIRQGGGKVTVETTGGDRHVASHAIVAVPPLVLSGLGFDPPLPPAKSAALMSVRPATGGKVAAQYEAGDLVRAAFRNGCFTDGPVNAAWVSDTDASNGPAVVAGLVSAAARATIEDEEAAVAALDELVETKTGSPVRRLASAAKNWAEDRYAFAAAITPGHGQWEGFVSTMARPHRRVHFAGDFTDDPFCSCIEGAARSGYRSADEILRWPERMNVASIEDELVRR